MADSAVETALAHWGPRLIQNGVDYNDLMATIKRTETWADWLPQWNRTADEQVAFAKEADASGHLLTAGQAWRRASVNRHFGKFVWMVDLELAAAATRQSVEGNAARAGPAGSIGTAPGDPDRRRDRVRQPAPTAGRRSAAVCGGDPGAGLDQGGVLLLRAVLPGSGDGDDRAGRSGSG